MSKVTVSKLQIAQAKECAHRCERYALGLDTIIKMCSVIIRDLESMLHDTKTLMNAKTDKADNLQKRREEELKNA